LGNGQRVTVTGTWTRFTLTFTVPSVQGKTLGTDGNSSTQLLFWLSSGSNYATRSGNVGQMVGSLYLWGVQLEVGTLATPLEKLDIGLQLLECQRFYTTGAGSYGTYTNAVSVAFLIALPFGVTMRGVPNCTVTSAGGGGYSSVVVYTATAWSLVIQATSSTSGQSMGFNYSYTASADF
jgi:hypothetical protein